VLPKKKKKIEKRRKKKKIEEFGLLRLPPV
jgi:hypothetical protein